jgi:hypothetical protein
VILVIAFAAVGVAAVVLYAQHRLSSVLGVYRVYSGTTHLRYGALPRSLVEHLATFSLGVGVVPGVIALAWIGANVLRPSRRPEAHAFACLGAAATIVFFVQATNFDLALDAYVHDRFLMYFVPIVLIGTVLALTDERKPRWSLAVPLGLIVAGFVFGDIPRVTWGQFVWLDVDTPVATVYRVLASHLGGLTATRGLLVGLAVVGTALFLLAGRTFRPRRVTVGLLAFCATAMLVVTTLVFRQAFTPLDINLRHITTSAHGTFDWIDEVVGPNGNVTAISYPVSSDWFVNQQRWFDFEFFNKSIQRVGRVAGSDPFDYVGIWFPKLDLHFDDSTGAVLESPTRWVVGSEKETRFRVAGTAKLAQQGAVLIDAGREWRLAWRTFGLYDDGWTVPGAQARMRVYPARGQRTAELRTVAFVLRGSPKGRPRHVSLITPGHVTRAVVGQEDVTEFVPICVPARGYAEIRLGVDGSSAIPGDLATLQDSLRPRRGGVFIASLSEADEVGGPCSA